MSPIIDTNDVWLRVTPDTERTVFMLCGHDHSQRTITSARAAVFLQSSNDLESWQLAVEAWNDAIFGGIIDC